MLSRIAKPTPWSVPSSNTIAILLTVLPVRIAGYAWVGSNGFNFFRVQPVSTAGSPVSAVTVLVAAWQPRKWSTLSMVTTLKRGAPAPQWLPSRISNPKTLVLFRTIPSTPVITTPEEALSAVSVLFESSIAKLFGPDASASPRPLTHAAATWFVLVGSNSNNAEPNDAP